MANNFIFVRLEYSGGSVPTGWAEFQTDETAVLPGNLNITGNGRRVMADMSNVTPANRLYFQTSELNAATNLGVIPNGTSNTSNAILYNTSNPANASRLRLQIGSGTADIISDNVGSGSFLPLTFNTSGTERARFDAAGNFYFGETSSTGTGPSPSNKPGWYHQFSNGYNQVRATGGGFMDIYLRSGGATILNFLPNGVTAGNVSCTATTTTYATSSDYRLKDDVQPLDPIEATNRIMAFRPVTWTWKVDGSYGKGFIAHECQAVDPMTATGEKDQVRHVGYVTSSDYRMMELVEEPADLSLYGIDASWEFVEEQPVYQGRDDSKMIPDMIAMMQRQESRIAELEAQLQYALTLLPVA